ncbi:repeat-containing on Y chromosome-like [Octopus vulgaris]|uniref:Repeat-containing on Y chromosome-like n=1 Tax=Octopus vulgaris TaxID=6645 RepID=A0AA36FHS0_OCTVU|nr:repeat-containing on Y chromosome-like [Octopus vulgaris]
MLPLSNLEKVRASPANERRQSDSAFNTTLRLETDLEVHEYKDLIKSKPNPRPRTASVDQKWHMVKMVKSDVQLANATWRRVTVKFINDMIPPDNLLYPGHLAKEKIENKLSIEVLKELGKSFRLSKKKSYLEINAEDFKRVLKQLLGNVVKEAEINALFMKVDFNAVGSITLNQFCTYVHLIYQDFFPKTITFLLPARGEPLPHREPICRLCENHNGTLITCSESPNPERRTPKWITDFLIMSKYNKLMVGTGNREIQFFEISSFHPYCQISNFESIPLRLDYALWKKKPKHENFIASVSLRSIISNPNIRFVCWTVHEDWVQQVKYCPQIKQVISCSNDANSALVIGCTISSVDVEQQMKFVKENSFSKNSLIGELEPPRTRSEHDQTTFKVHKGVKCFDFNKKKNILVTGGMDRLIRIWNPYVPGKPTDILHGHSAPIFYVYYSEEDNWIFSVSSDKCIKVWNATDYSCINTVRPKSHLIHGDLSTVYYSNLSKTLAFTTNVLATLSIKIKSKPCLLSLFDIATSHSDPVTSIKYNKIFKHIVTSSEGSEVKVWDVVSGSFISQFGHAHGEKAITCMNFDESLRRLITGGQDGNVKIWNYNSGLCLKELTKKKKEELIDECDPAEICDLIYIEMNRRSKYVVAVGWDQRINIYEDNFDSTVHFVHHPSKNWEEDLKNGHTEEILCIAQSASHMLATASYDGEIIVWKLMSGHIFCHLRAPMPFEYQNVSIDGDLSIKKLLFIDYKPSNPCKAQLISNGPYSCIHFWNIFNDGQLLAQFSACQKKGAMVTSMALNSSNTVLFSTDTFGFIYAWDIDGYCGVKAEEYPPPLIGKWRGHTKSISEIIFVDDYQLLVTASSDCRVRVWTTEGLYIGVFGQNNLWNIHKPETFEHPLIPFDVLTDALSLPEYISLIPKEPDESEATNNVETNYQILSSTSSKEADVSLHDELKAELIQGLKAMRQE